MSYNGLIELVKLVDIITVIIVLTAGHFFPSIVLVDITNIRYFQFRQVRLGALTLAVTIQSPRCQGTHFYQTIGQSQQMLKAAGTGPGQRTQAIYLRKHNKRPEGPLLTLLTVLWQFLANTTKSEQSISLLTLPASAFCQSPQLISRHKTLSQSVSQTSAAELSQQKQES